MPAKKKRRRVKVHLVKQNHRLTFRKEKKNGKQNCYSAYRKNVQNCRLWLVILTAVDPSQLPRLRFILSAFVLISERVVFLLFMG